MLKVGEKAPEFEARDQAGDTVTLAALVRDKPLVLYFYPRDFTPICTAQACGFRDAYAEIVGLGAEVAGVSADDQASHARFAAEHRIPYRLLSDPGHRIADAFGLEGLFGLFRKRVTFVIDRTGTIRGAFHHEVSARAHVHDVREALRTLAA